jgi:hypothetical protein
VVLWQAEVAAICFDLFCDAWLIYDNRNALQQQIDEWDDRPWQQRRRLALSLRFMSRWEGWHAEFKRGGHTEDLNPTMHRWGTRFVPAMRCGGEA